MKRIIFAAIAAMLMLAAPARADTLIVTVLINPNLPPDEGVILHAINAQGWLPSNTVQINEISDPLFVEPGYYVLYGVVDVPSAVPEPSTWAMLLIGFVGLGFVFRLSRRKPLFA
jgi:hypothetical protein